jgi:hypothetical protein
MGDKEIKIAKNEFENRHVRVIFILFYNVYYIKLELIYF